MTMTLINKLNTALQPNYQAVIQDIPEQYINVPMNRTKSTQCVEISDTKSGDIFIDFYYNEFNLTKLKEEGEKWLNHRDRDMDPVTAGHFRKIANILIQL
jgi:hypothetical protein